jgi:hypothetical protein
MGQRWSALGHLIEEALHCCYSVIFCLHQHHHHVHHHHCIAVVVQVTVKQFIFCCQAVAYVQACSSCTWSLVWSELSMLGVWCDQSSSAHAGLEVGVVRAQQPCRAQQPMHLCVNLLGLLAIRSFENVAGVGRIHQLSQKSATLMIDHQVLYVHLVC